MSPEFHGIHLLYLNSKIIALRAVTIMLFSLLALTMGVAWSLARQVDRVQYGIEEGNNVKCEEGYISKIVEGTRVSCIMRRVAPGDSTYLTVLKKGVK